MLDRHARGKTRIVNNLAFVVEELQPGPVLFT